MRDALFPVGDATPFADGADALAIAYFEALEDGFAGEPDCDGQGNDAEGGVGACEDACPGGRWDDVPEA